MAIGIGAALGGLHVYLSESSQLWIGIYVRIYKACTAPIGVAIVFFIPILLVSVSICGVLTKKYGPKTYDLETRCRKCGYILRGIPEPRCSECGEKI